MKHFVLWLLFSLGLNSCIQATAPDSHFSFHLFMEPQHLDPARSRASSASYFFYNTLRGIYKIDEKDQPVPEGGKCHWLSDLQLKCQLAKFKWSNGEPVTAKDYVRSFRHLVDPSVASPRSQLLKFVKGAIEITSDLKPPSTLSVFAIDKKTLLIDFIKRDREFLYKLASTALYPTHKNHQVAKQKFKEFVVNGPYQVKSWKTGGHIWLKPNPHYPLGHKDRPPIKIYFIDDEMTAFRLYETKVLSFLRRIPSQMIAKIKERPDFFQKPMLRFDYYGFGPSLQQELNFRKALSLSIDYEKLKKLLGALERPGCPSIPKKWLIDQKCFSFEPQSLEQFRSFLPSGIATKKIQLKISHLGGKDIKKQAEFYQHQWKENLGVNIRVNQVEQKVFLRELRSSPPDIFRKGVGLDRPTCLSALETFSEDSHQNYLNILNSKYKSIVNQMRNHEVFSIQYKELCQKGMDFLMSEYRLIPLGEMHFTLMASPDFSGWTLNGLNQLDLSHLHKKQ